MAVKKDDPRTIFGWCMYDWANSAYATVSVGLLPVYFASVVVGEQGLTLAGHHFATDSLWGFMVGIADFIAFLCAPVLGAIADFSAAKKRFLLFFAYAGSLFTVLLYFSQSGDAHRTMILFVAAQVAFINANVVYDAFLPQIASDDKMDWVSGKGYSYGYVGGGIQFGVALALVSFHATLGISQATAVRIGIATAGLWWGAFTLVTARYLHEDPAAARLPEGKTRWPWPVAYIGIGISRTWRTLLRVRRFRHLILFLLAFMLYNDGIQTVLNMATTYGTVELKLPASALLLTLLIIQGVAAVGAMLFAWIGPRLGTRRAIMVTLVLWCGVVTYAYFIHTAAEFFILGMIVGLVMGGSQALSRSYYGSMIPEGASAEFYGFYTVFTKFSSIGGPFAFAIIKQMTGSSRLAIVSLMFFFVAGLVLLSLVDEEKARSARTAGAF